MDTSAPVTVVGASPSGLASAIVLVRAGKKIVVRESHKNVGGHCATRIALTFEYGRRYEGHASRPRMNISKEEEMDHTCINLIGCRLIVDNTHDACARAIASS